MSLIDNLYQGRTWRPNIGDEIPISQMDTRHLQNVLNWLWRNRASLKMAAEAGMAFGPHPHGDAAMDAFESAFDELLSESDESWVVELPVVVAIQTELRSRDAPVWGSARG